MSLPELELPGGVRVMFTDRSDGNLSSVGGEGREHGERARERLRERIGTVRLLRGYQAHGSHVVRVAATHEHRPTAAPDPAAPADGQATSARGLAPLVLGADCLPVALGAPGAVAMVHAGWRGIAAGVLEEGVGAVRELAGGEDIVALVGPGAGLCCYEVGPEVHAALATGIDRRAKIDLRAIVQARLEAAGAVHVEHLERCTICDERFFSNRREGERAGRQGGVAWLT